MFRWKRKIGSLGNWTVIGSFCLWGTGLAPCEQPAKRIEVPVPQNGSLVFDEITLCRYSEVRGEKIPEFTARVINQTDTAWKDARFRMSLWSANFSETLDLYPFDIPTEGRIITERLWELITKFPGCNFIKADISFSGGISEKDLKAAAIARAAERLAAETRLAADELARKKQAETRRTLALQQQREREATASKARAEFLAKFPTIQSGFNSAFVGSDKKCSAQFMEAVAMEGLEKRKRLADLVSFGCGFIAPNFIHVAVERKDGSFAFVKIIDGEKAGKDGWVPLSWVK